MIIGIQAQIVITNTVDKIIFATIAIGRIIKTKMMPTNISLKR